MLFSATIKTLLLTLLAAFTAAQTQSITDLFTIDDSCSAAQIAQLNVIVRDARTMVASGRKAIATLKTATRFLPGTTRNLMNAAHNTFGTEDKAPSLSSSPFSPDDLNTFTIADSNLAMIESLLAGQAPQQYPNAQLGPNNAYLACSPNNYQTTTDATLIDPSLPQGSQIQQQQYWPNNKAAYVIPIPQFPPSLPFTTPNGLNRRVIRPQGNSAPGICPDTTFTALTQRVNGANQNQPLIQIVLCPHFWDGSYRSSIGDAPGSGLPRRVYLGNWKYQASAFVHELFHTMSDKYGDLTFYRTGPPPGPNIATYGPAAIAALATTPDRFTFIGKIYNLPDTYRLFLDMAQYPGTRWTSSST